MRRLLRDNGLTIVLLTIFLATLVGQALTGWHVDSEERLEHGQAALSFLPYLQSGAFLSALFENWESEFLQMWAFVMLTAILFQKGSEESKDPDAPNEVDRDPALDRDKPDAPWPVRAGGIWSKLYSHSLGAALLLLFLASFALHAVNSWRHEEEQALQHGQALPSFWEHLASSSFWFESFQNWQSEFLSTAVLIVLAIFLRERGSPESKPVGDPHHSTGS